MTVNFDTTPTEASQIAAIADRYLSLIGHDGQQHMRLDIQMDLTACHLNGCPLRLQDMMEGTDFGLAHDVQGIQDHLDRTTGRLRGLDSDPDTPAFSPRFSAQPTAEKKEA